MEIFANKIKEDFMIDYLVVTFACDDQLVAEWKMHYIPEKSHFIEIKNKIYEIVKITWYGECYVDIRLRMLQEK